MLSSSCFMNVSSSQISLNIIAVHYRLFLEYYVFFWGSFSIVFSSLFSFFKCCILLQVLKDFDWPFIFKDEETEGLPERCVCVRGLHLFIVFWFDVSRSWAHCQARGLFSTPNDAGFTLVCQHLCPNSSQMLVLLPQRKTLQLSTQL